MNPVWLRGTGTQCVDGCEANCTAPAEEQNGSGPTVRDRNVIGIEGTEEGRDHIIVLRWIYLIMQSYRCGGENWSAKSERKYNIILTMLRQQLLYWVKKAKT